MIKEELEKEVEKYLENKYCYNVCACNEVEECRDNLRVRCMSFNHKKELILNFAEQRENRTKM